MGQHEELKCKNYFYPFHLTYVKALRIMSLLGGNHMKVTHLNRVYIHSKSGRWVTKQGEVASEFTQNDLNKKYKEIIRENENQAKTREERLDASFKAEKRGDYQAALRLNAPREGESWTAGMAVRESSLYRKRNDPKAALKATEPFKNLNFEAIHTTRAAAYCDLDDCERAVNLIRKALATGRPKPSAETWSVLNRIKSECPYEWANRKSPNDS